MVDEVQPKNTYIKILEGLGEPTLRAVLRKQKETFKEHNYYEGKKKIRFPSNFLPFNLVVTIIIRVDQQIHTST